MGLKTLNGCIKFQYEKWYISVIHTFRQSCLFTCFVPI
jgi:hypothetical protein